MVTTRDPASVAAEVGYRTDDDDETLDSSRFAESLAYVAERARWDMPAVRDLLERCRTLIPSAAPESVELADLLDSLHTPRSVSPKAAAQVLNVSSPNTIKAWIRRGLFPNAVRTFGGHWKIPVSDVATVYSTMADAREFARSLRVPLSDEPIDEIPG